MKSVDKASHERVPVDGEKQDFFPGGAPSYFSPTSCSGAAKSIVIIMPNS